MLKTLKRRTHVGFTLLEMLVVAAVSILLGVTVVNIFFQSRKSLDHATGRIEMVQTARVPVNRIAFYLSSTVAIPSIEALAYPALGGLTNIDGVTIDEDDPNTWDPLIVFRTTEDFFAESAHMGYDFDPESIMNITDIKNNLEVWERDDQRLTEYVIWFEDDVNIDWIPDATNVLAIARFDDLTLSEDRDTVWVTGTWFTGPDPTSSFHPGVDVRIIGRRLKSVRFRRRLQNGIQVAIETEKEIRAAHDKVTKTFRLDTLIQLPSQTMN